MFADLASSIAGCDGQESDAQGGVVQGGQDQLFQLGSSTGTSVGVVRNHGLETLDIGLQAIAFIQ
ncbi:hypothetical protein D3C80_2235380 [compost metagenome]